MIIRIHHILRNTTAEGPGNRYCIWVQGCHRKCVGCMAKDTWNENGGKIEKTENIMEDIRNRLNQSPRLEGITFLGGEPFLQAAALAEIAEFAQKKHLSVFCFTGYLVEELRESTDVGVKKLLNNIDLLADGPYVQMLRDFSRPWVGSRNQRFLFLTQRYTPDDIFKCKNRLEIRIRPDGSVVLNGMADFEIKEKERKEHGNQSENSS